MLENSVKQKKCPLDNFSERYFFLPYFSEKCDISATFLSTYEALLGKQQSLNLLF